MKHQKKESLIYQNDFRSTYHVLHEVRDHLQGINRKLAKGMPEHLKVTFVVHKHFGDRFLERKGNMQQIKRIISYVVDHNLCELIFYTEITKQHNLRLTFYDTVSRLCFSWNPETRIFGLRTFIHNADYRTDKREIPEFVIMAKNN